MWTHPPAHGKLPSLLPMGFFPPHKLCLIGSVSIQHTVTANDKGYFSGMAMFVLVFVPYASVSFAFLMALQPPASPSRYAV